MARLVITDIAWPDIAIETALASAAGHDVVLAESDEHLRSLAPSAAAILTCFRRVPADVLDIATQCVTVARYGVGVDNIDVAHATSLGMIVSNVPEFCTEEVADHTLMLVLAAMRRLLPSTDATRSGGWAPSPGTARRIRGLVFGIVGFGAIGRAVAERAHAFGFDVIVASRSLGRDGGALPGTVSRVVERDELYAQSDIVALHLPLTPDTHHLVGARELGTMKDGALLVNVSRGGLVDTDALRPHLASGRLSAALDVTDPEPLPADHWLRTDPHAIITPHVAFASDGSLVELATKATSHALAVLAGADPGSVVNPEVLTSTSLRATLDHSPIHPSKKRAGNL